MWVDCASGTFAPFEYRMSASLSRVFGSSNPAPARFAPTRTALDPWTWYAVAKGGIPSPATARPLFSRPLSGSSSVVSERFSESYGGGLIPPVRSVNAARKPARSSELGTIT